MKFFAFFHALVLVQAFGFISTSQDGDWEKFKVDFTKTFDSPADETFRKNIFLKNLETIERHNIEFQRDAFDFQMGINNYTDMTFDEYYAIHNPKDSSTDSKEEEEDEEERNFYRFRGVEYPAAFDWRSKGAVTKVKDQKTCGACYAMAGISAIESHYFINHNELRDFSVQEVIDCAEDKHDAKKCLGGSEFSVMKYINEHGGISLAADYPYESQAGECRTKSKKVEMNVTRYNYVNSQLHAEILQEALFRVGPMIITMDINNESFMRYSSGIYSQAGCSNETNHVALLVGYGVENEKEFWIVKNSFGEKWGEEGYMRVKFTNDLTDCALHMYPIYPVFKKNRQA